MKDFDNDFVGQMRGDPPLFLGNPSALERPIRALEKGEGREDRGGILPPFPPFPRRPFRARFMWPQAPQGPQGGP
jgi:hypothetical protein